MNDSVDYFTNYRHFSSVSYIPELSKIRPTPEVVIIGTWDDSPSSTQDFHPLSTSVTRHPISTSNLDSGYLILLSHTRYRVSFLPSLVVQTPHQLAYRRHGLQRCVDARTLRPLGRQHVVVDTIMPPAIRVTPPSERTSLSDLRGDTVVEDILCTTQFPLRYVPTLFIHSPI
jgi:hypothetical protein